MNGIKSTLPSHFIGCGADYDTADTVLFGAPFDGTVTFRPGSRFAPAHMRADSWGLETYSPYFERDLDDYAICDAGDLDIPFGNTVKSLSIIRDCVQQIADDNKTPFMIGGEHLVTLPAVEVLAKKYADLCVIHFDAHTDLRQDYIGEQLSHSTVMRRVWDITGDGSIYQLGIRSGTREEFDWAKAHTNMTLHNTENLSKYIKMIGTRPVYLTIDLDVLDPSVLPGTGTPEAGGISFIELSNALQMMDKLNIIGADLVELAPHYDNSGASTAVACKVAREMLLLLQK